MSLSRRWPSWIILLCWLTPADATSCFAADPPPPARPVDAKPGAAAAPRMAEKKRPDPPANRGSLLGAIVEAMGGDLDGNRRRAQAAEEQTVRNMEPQFRPQFQQLLYCELAFLRRVCKPDPKSFAEVAKAAKAGLQAPLREYIVSRWVPRPGVPQGMNAADPRSAMQKMLLALVKEKLAPEKVQLYCQECDKRAEARKRAVVVNLVALLDERLLLTSEQRGKLVQALSANYEKSWDQFFEVFGIGSQSVPAIRDESIVGLLDEHQKSVWRQTTKQSGVFFSGQVFQTFIPAEATEIQEIAHIVEEGKNDR